MITQRAVEPRQRRGEAVEDRVVERAALVRIGDRQPRDAGRRLVDEQAPARAPLLEDNERVALGDRLTLLARISLDHAGVLGLDGHLHLHRLEDDHRVALVDAVADLDLDLPDGAGDVRLDLGNAVSLLCSWGRGGG